MKLSTKHALEKLQADAETTLELPQVMEKMPKPDELRSVTIGGSGGTDGQSLAGVVAQVVSVVNALQGVGKNGK